MTQETRMEVCCNDIDEDTYKSIVIKYQRDVNCLSDPDRNVRKRSLIKFQREIRGIGLNDKGVRQHFFSTHLKAPLLQIFSDQVEKCRELAIGIVSSYIEDLESVEATDDLFPKISEILTQRIGVTPFAESAEEVRLLLLELLETLLDRGSTKIIQDSMDKVATVLCKALSDQFPDSKRACNTIIRKASVKCPQRIKRHTPSIVRPLVANLQHQHAKVRSTTLQALETIIPCGSEAMKNIMEESVYPAIRKLVHDRTASVRKQLVVLLSTWFIKMEDIKEYEALLFPLLLSMVSDDAPDVQTHAINALSSLGPVWEANTMDESNFGSNDMLYKPLPPFTDRPHRGARAKARMLLDSVLNPILEATGDWTVQTRTRSSATLRTLIILAEDAINPYLAQIVGALAKVCRDDEPEVGKMVGDCVYAMGRYADGEVLFSTLVPLAIGTNAGHDTATHKSNGLVLLALSVRGMQLESILPHLDRITEAICDRGLLAAEDLELQEQVSSVAGGIITVAKQIVAKDETFCFRLFWCLNQMAASSPKDSVVYEKSWEYLRELAAANSNGTIEELYKVYVPRLLDTMDLPDGDDRCWTKMDPSRLLFDFICRNGGQACAENIERIIPVFVAHLNAARDPDIRLVFLALLETMLGIQSVSESFKPHSTTILLHCIMPSIVWRSGLVASTVRKVAMACTYTLLERGLASKPCLFQTGPQILPVLKSCLDDDDATTRNLVCLALQYLFMALPNSLSDQAVNELYPEILKRLDDSNDLVRRSGCATFIGLLGCAQKDSFKGTPIDYSLDCLFVHLDDPEREIQEAVYRAIEATIPIDQSLVLKKAKEHRMRHRSPHYCDQLIAQLSP